MPELTLSQAWVLLPLGLAVGTLGTMVGVGGGILLVPALLVLYPLAEPAVITSMSLTAVVLNAASATVGYRYRRWQDTRTGIILIAAAVPAAVAGAFLTRAVERGSFELVMGVLLALGAAYLAWRGSRLPKIQQPAPTGRVRHIVDRRHDVYDYRVNEPLAAGLAFVVGFIAAFFGIGGGPINVPVMMLVLKMPARMAVATSQLELLFASATAVMVHLAITWGEWDPWIRGVIIGTGTLLGAQIGVRLASKASGGVVLLLIAAILFTAGVRQIFNGLG
jgi:hypothetical protein